MELSRKHGLFLPTVVLYHDICAIDPSAQWTRIYEILIHPGEEISVYLLLHLLWASIKESGITHAIIL